jgi:predicted DNA-binding transcriptional regulator AlpA
MLDRRNLVNPVLPDPLIDVRGAATTLGVSVRTVYSLMAKGMLQPVRVLGRTLFDPADIRAFIERAKQGESTPRQKGGAE